MKRDITPRDQPKNRKASTGLHSLALALFGLVAVTHVQQASAQAIWSFDDLVDGSAPESKLVADSAGHLYGTNSKGGIDDNSGTVFELSPNPDGTWSETGLFKFADEAMGYQPENGVVLDDEGSLYGTTTYGGNFFEECDVLDRGCGVIFKLTRGQNGEWTQSVLYAFSGYDGARPGGLIRDAQGNLYGTAASGGLGYGVVFRLSASGKYDYYQFHGKPDGDLPTGGLVADTAGNLYGATSFGGNDSCSCGTIFRINTKGQEKVLYRFRRTDGGSPEGTLTLANGSLYGTTQSPAGDGTVFRLTSSGTLQTLYSFTGKGDGGDPNGGVVLDAAGNIYGTTGRGGKNHMGTVYKLKPDGSGAILLHLDNATGSNPHAGLVFGPQGYLYGTAIFGGEFDGGTVFKVAPQ